MCSCALKIVSIVLLALLMWLIAKCIHFSPAKAGVDCGRCERHTPHDRLVQIKRMDEIKGQLTIR